jgi:hypothetical protein
MLPTHLLHSALPLAVEHAPAWQKRLQVGTASSTRPVQWGSRPGSAVLSR